MRGCDVGLQQLIISVIEYSVDYFGGLFDKKYCACCITLLLLHLSAIVIFLRENKTCLLNELPHWPPPWLGHNLTKNGSARRTLVPPDRRFRTDAFYCSTQQTFRGSHTQKAGAEQEQSRSSQFVMIRLRQARTP